MYYFTSDQPEMQKSADFSYVGGIPMIPEGFTIPNSPDRESELCFMFQCMFEPDHFLSGRILSVFMDLTMSEFGDFVPSRYLKDFGKIKKGDLQKFKQRYAFFLFDMNNLVHSKSYMEKVSFHCLRPLDDTDEDHVSDDGEGNLLYHDRKSIPEGRLCLRVGNTPLWRGEPEYPKAIRDYKSPSFICQINRMYTFYTLDDAPNQNDFGIHNRFKKGYDMFASSEAYIFWFGNNIFYAISQI